MTQRKSSILTGKIQKINHQKIEMKSFLAPLSFVLLMAIAQAQTSTNQFNGCATPIEDYKTKKLVCAFCYRRKFDKNGKFCSATPQPDSDPCDYYSYNFNKETGNLCVICKPGYSVQYLLVKIKSKILFKFFFNFSNFFS